MHGKAVTPRRERRPTAAELGLEVTVGIVALAGNCIVAASDERISFNDVHIASDQARKSFRVAHTTSWHVSFAAADVTHFPPFIRAVDQLLGDNTRPDALTMMRVAQHAYGEVVRRDFWSTRLTQLGFASVEEFRTDGFQQLGAAQYADYLRDLNRHDIGLELIFFGHREPALPFFFRVVNPGKVIEDATLGNSVIGSGTYLAQASLRLKPMPNELEQVVYRVLEAKFSSETASFVGDTTYLVVLKPDETHVVMQPADIAEVKAAWKQSIKLLAPQEARSVIYRSLQNVEKN